MTLRTTLLVATIVLPAFSASKDRSALEWVLHVGGSVVMECGRTAIWDLTKLPLQDFQIEGINLIDVLIEPDELMHVSALAGLKDLYICKHTWRNNRIPDPFAVLANLTSLEKLALTHLAPLKNVKELRLDQTDLEGKTLAPFVELWSLDLTQTLISDAGLTTLYLRDTGSEIRS